MKKKRGREVTTHKRRGIIVTTRGKEFVSAQDAECYIDMRQRCGGGYRVLRKKPRD
mgnify:CR=1 FL=1